MDAIKKTAINSNSSDDLVRYDLEAMIEMKKEDELNGKGLRLYHIYSGFFDLCQEILTLENEMGTSSAINMYPKGQMFRNF